MGHPIHLIIRILLRRRSHLGEHTHRTRRLHVFQTRLSTFFFLQFLVTNFPNLFFQETSLFGQTIEHKTKITSVITPSYVWLFLLPSSVSTLLYSLKMCPREDFPSPRSFRHVPEKSTNAAPVLFWVVPVKTNFRNFHEKLISLLSCFRKYACCM